MVIRSCLYECTVSHSRSIIIGNKFYYKYFMFYLDLDEIDYLSSNLALFSRNRFNVFNFRDRDHLVFDKPGVKENILKYLSDKGVVEEIKKIQEIADNNIRKYGLRVEA